MTSGIDSCTRAQADVLSDYRSTPRRAFAMSTALDQRRRVQKPPPQGSARTRQSSATLHPILRPWPPATTSRPQMKGVLLSVHATNINPSPRQPQRTICRRRRCSTRWTHNPQLKCPMPRQAPSKTSLQKRHAQGKGRATDVPAKPAREQEKRHKPQARRAETSRIERRNFRADWCPKLTKDSFNPFASVEYTSAQLRPSLDNDIEKLFAGNSHRISTRWSGRASPKSTIITTGSCELKAPDAPMEWAGRRW